MAHDCTICGKPATETVSGQHFCRNCAEIYRALYLPEEAPPLKEK